jgi:hypothetical protein
VTRYEGVVEMKYLAPPGQSVCLGIHAWDLYTYGAKVREMLYVSVIKDAR